MSLPHSLQSLRLNAPSNVIVLLHDGTERSSSTVIHALLLLVDCGWGGNFAISRPEYYSASVSVKLIGKTRVRLTFSSFLDMDAVQTHVAHAVFCPRELVAATGS